ncbi:DUF697 domain-containing protein [Pseudorhodoplanes sp.]|uniref:DUF697 domain-containing protein n=1 Tax=Pseudorhodoplanes sp. TaxID=1934341 RepID=UPI003D11B8BE
MTRKQLPKAIKPAHTIPRTIDLEAEAEPRHPLPRQGAEADAAETAAYIWSPTPPPANDVHPDMNMIADPQAEQRLRSAFRVVERHKMYAGLGGLVPMAAVNVASVTAVNLRMVKVLSDLYGVPFERDKTRSIVIGLLGGAAPAGLAAATASTFAFVVPLAGALGLVVSTVAAASLTGKIGLYFIERFEHDVTG